MTRDRPGHRGTQSTERSFGKLGQQETEQKPSTAGFLHERNKTLKLSLNRAPGAVGGVCTGEAPGVPVQGIQCPLVPDMAEAAALTWQDEWRCRQ